MLGYIEKIAVFIIMEGIILRLVQGEDFRKMIKMCCGMILIILVLSPLDNILGFSASLKEFLNDITEAGNAEQVKEAIAISGENDIERVKREYEAEIARQLKATAADYGYQVESVDVTFDERQADYLGSVNILLSNKNGRTGIGTDRIVIGAASDKKVEKPDIIAIKNAVVDTWKIKYEKIIIRVSS